MTACTPGLRLFPAWASLALVAMSMTALPSGAAAQAGAALEEIVVTASKRGAVDLQSAPATITAYTGDKLEQLGFDDFEDYAGFTPGLDFQKVGPSRSQIIVRGVTLGRVSQAEPQNRSVVGLYLDDIPIAQNGYNVDPDLFDLERVEIVKGPQGSLFGDSAMAGAIRYVTRTPSLTERDARLLSDVSFTEDGGTNYDVKGAFGAPIVPDLLALRGTFYYRNNSGWIDNIVNGNDDINEEETVGGRAALFWQPLHNLSAKLSFLVQSMDGGGPPREETGIGRPPAGSLDWAHPLDDSIDDDMFLTSLTVNWDLGWLDVTNVASFQEREIENRQRGAMHDTFLFFFGVELPDNTLRDPWFFHRLTEEVRIATKTGGMFDATVGLYYSDGTTDYGTFASATGFDQFAIDFFGFPNLAAVKSLGCSTSYPDHFFCGSQVNDEEQIAVFGEVYWNITDALQFTAGGRWFDYDQRFDENYGGFFNGEPTSGIVDISESDFNPKFGLQYRVNDDVMLYGSAAKGFRLGGVNDPLPSFCDPELAALGLSEARTYESDTLWSYEGGVKSTLLDGRLILNGSGYYTKWKDIQTRILLPLCGFLVTQNASAQEIFGGEVEAGWLAMDGLRFNVSAAYTDSALVGDAPAVSGRDGDRAPYIPRWKLAAFVDYDFALTSNIGGFASFGVRHASKSWNTYNRLIKIPAQTVGNLRLGARMDRYTLTLFADNLWNERIVTDADLSLHGADRSIGRPRTIGAELGVEF
jgi:outer membrane receptor protein involved in Fe transport